MKTTVLIILGVSLIAAGAYLAGCRRAQPEPHAAAQPEPTPVVVDTPSVASPVQFESRPQPAVVEQHGSNRPVQSVPQAPAASVAGSLSFQQALATLVSPQAAFGEKQLAWTQLRDTGKLDQAIVELEKSAVANPTSAEYPATLGQAYLQKAGTLKDIREQGILGMKADQSFDAALTLDSANWDAAFWKASAMSYWPPQLGKTQEVLDRFTELAKQQETLPAQPQFAQTYVLLGEQYQKLGQADYASQVWQHGAALFPNDPKLAEKISGQPAGQPAAR